MSVMCTSPLCESPRRSLCEVNALRRLSSVSTNAFSREPSPESAAESVIIQGTIFYGAMRSCPSSPDLSPRSLRSSPSSSGSSTPALVQPEPTRPVRLAFLDEDWPELFTPVGAELQWRCTPSTDMVCAAKGMLHRTCSLGRARGGKLPVPAVLQLEISPGLQVQGHLSGDLSPRTPAKVALPLFLDRRCLFV